MNGIIVIGSNYGDRERAIEEAVDFIKSVAVLLCRSEIYESKDYLGAGRPYLNTVIEVECDKNDVSLKKLIKNYEMIYGRTSDMKERGEVPIDIDIVIWEGEIKRKLDYEAAYFTKGFNQLKKPQIL